MIVGIDPSLTGTGVCILYNSRYFTYECITIKPRKLRGMERLRFIKEQLQEILEHDKVEFAVIEGYSYGSFGRTFELGELGSVVKLLLDELNIKYYIVPPTKWKKAIIGTGNANKHKVRWEMEKKGFIFDTQDECDAFCLALYGRKYILENINS